MKKKEAIEKIREAMKELEIPEKKDFYSVQELQGIAAKVNINMFYVMQYLRYGRL